MNASDIGKVRAHFATYLRPAWRVEQRDPVLRIYAMWNEKGRFDSVLPRLIALQSC
jgi:hypothetical protein